MGRKKKAVHHLSLPKGRAGKKISRKRHDEEKSTSADYTPIQGNRTGGKGKLHKPEMSQTQTATSKGKQRGIRAEP